MNLKNSPLARSPPTMAFIPGVTNIVNDPNELPDRYSSTPGGTLYSTTPGGE